MHNYCKIDFGQYTFELYGWDLQLAWSELTDFFQAQCSKHKCVALQCGQHALMGLYLIRIIYKPRTWTFCPPHGISGSRASRNLHVHLQWAALEGVGSGWWAGCHVFNTTCHFIVGDRESIRNLKAKSPRQVIQAFFGELPTNNGPWWNW